MIKKDDKQFKDMIKEVLAEKDPVAFLGKVAQRLVSNEEVDELLMHELKIAQDILSSGTKELIPSLTVISTRNDKGKRSNAKLLLAGDMGDGDAKRKVFMGLGQRVAKEMPNLSPVAVLFISEAWMRKFKQDEAEEFNKSNKRVSEYEDKQDVIIASALTIDKREKTMVLEVTHDKDGNIVPGKLTVQEGAENYLLHMFFFGHASVTINK